MRQLKNVAANINVSREGPLSAEMLAQLRGHRWDRQPASWSQ
jgi:hypothetical protein